MSVTSLSRPDHAEVTTSVGKAKPYYLVILNKKFLTQLDFCLQIEQVLRLIGISHRMCCLAQ
ncbi:hypothetical protein F9Y84_05010 [Pseudoalteromonas peptidolytica]|nr:hypothetical protein [Pseudoalteromonas peptidolytica]